MNSIQYHDVRLDFVHRVGGVDTFVVTDPISYSNGLGETQTVPVGTQTDGATIPRILWGIVGHPLMSSYVKAAVVHDYHCTQAWASGDYHRRVIADSLFRYLLNQSGVGFWKASILYFAVRWWGWISYIWGAK